MRFLIRLVNPLAVAAVVALSALTALAQDNAVVLFDATHKNVFCAVPDQNQIVMPVRGAVPLNPNAPDTRVLDVRGISTSQPCAYLANNQGFLVQGQRNQLQVIKRKFLTQYAFFVDNVTPVVNFPIEDLNEAANLTTPLSNAAAGVSKGGVPKGLATNGALQPRATQDLIAELLNPGTTSNAANEIASDWVVVKREAENVRNDARAFKATWSAVLGPAIAANEQACRPAYGAPTLTTVSACLEALNQLENEAPFPLAAAPYSDEDAFRRLVVRDNDAITMMTSLGSVLSQQMQTLATQLSAFDGDLALLRADMSTLAGNVEAVQNAVDLLTEITPTMKKDQIKARIIQQLNSGAKPVLDDAEISVLTNDYYSVMQTQAGKDAVSDAALGLERLWIQGVAQANTVLADANNLSAPVFENVAPCPAGVPDLIRLGCIADQVDARYSWVLEQDHLQLSGNLSDRIAAINAAQSQLLARANEIYDNSEVAVPLEKAINLGGQTGNLRVYFTIYETETFPRFNIPTPSPTAGPVLTATPAVVSAPAAPGASTTTTTTAAATTTTTTPPPQPSGNAVTSGVLDVHDKYRATMVAAFAFSPSLKETTFVTTAITTGMATGSTTTNPAPCTFAAPCTQLTVSRGPAHSSVIVGMSFHPFGYDTFPGAFSWTRRPGEALRQAFGIFGGLSVQNLNDYYGGLDLQVAHGVQIMGGVNLYRQSTLIPGYVSGDIYPGTISASTFTGAQRWTHGAYFGIGLNLSIFRKAFGSVTGLGTTAPSSGS
jgi:hypothetical protein